MSGIISREIRRLVATTHRGIEDIIDASKVAQQLCPKFPNMDMAVLTDLIVREAISHDSAVHWTTNSSRGVGPFRVPAI